MGLVKVGIVGCGFIGSELCRAIKAGRVQATVAALNDVVPEHAEKLKAELGLAAPIVPFRELVEVSDVVAECATSECVPDVVEAAISRRRTALILSVGGLMLRPELLEQANRAGTPLIIPSGALAGVDAVEAAAEDVLEQVFLTTTKPPAGLQGAPYVLEKGIDLDAIKEPTVVFEGTAAEAVVAFPRNVNVAATLSIAGIGSQRTKVKIVADPAVSANTHVVTAVGAFGKLVTKAENVPAECNPKTSRLAALSALAALRKAIARS